MNRRHFLALLAWLWPWTKATPQPLPPERPWTARGIELEAEEGDWSDFVAWEEWIVQELGDRADATLPPLTIDRVWLYEVCAKLADGDYQTTTTPTRTP